MANDYVLEVLLLLCLLLSGPPWEAGRNRIEVRAQTSDGSRARETSALPVDFDGDGVSDIGIYRDGTWAIIRSSGGGLIVDSLGDSTHTPVPAEYDGDCSLRLVFLFQFFCPGQNPSGRRYLLIPAFVGYQPI